MTWDASFDFSAHLWRAVFSEVGCVRELTMDSYHI